MKKNVEALEAKNTIAGLIEKKRVSIEKNVDKQSNLDAQIDLYVRAKEKLEDEADLQRNEMDLLVGFGVKASALSGAIERNLAYTDSLLEKFAAIPFRPDLPAEDRIENSDFDAKVAERRVLEAELKDVLKQANKVYYRR